MSDADGTDLSKVTASSLQDTAAAAIRVGRAAQARHWLQMIGSLSSIASLALVAGLLGQFFVRAPSEPVSAGSGSGSAAVVAPAASGSAATAEPTLIPYDAKMVAADAVLGRPEGTGEVVHAAHPADAAAADAGTSEQ